MMPTASRTTVLVGLAAILALAVFFVVSVRRGSLSGIRETFAPPVYSDNAPPEELIRPLYLEASSDGLAAFSAEQKHSIDGFKQKILARIASQKPLSEEEKTVLGVSISTSAKRLIGRLILVDQTTLQFSPHEIALIADALKK